MESRLIVGYQRPPNYLIIHALFVGSSRQVAKYRLRAHRRGSERYRLFSTVRDRIDKRTSGSVELQHRDLRSGTKPDGQASYANAAIHVELLATVFVQASDVRYAHKAAEVEPTVNEIE